jgi:hypothetical protein
MLAIPGYVQEFPEKLDEVNRSARVWNYLAQWGPDEVRLWWK